MPTALINVSLAWTKVADIAAADFMVQWNASIPLAFATTAADSPPMFAGTLYDAGDSVSREGIGTGYVWARMVNSVEGGAIPVAVVTSSAGGLSVAQIDALRLGNLLADDGGVRATSELWPAQTTLTTGTTNAWASGPGEYGGFLLRSTSGGVTVTVYDALTVTGTPIHTASGSALAAYLIYAPSGARRQIVNGLTVVVSGTGVIELLKA